MNVGDHLKDAAAGVARANALTRTHPPHDAGEQAIVAVARTRIYHQLHHQLQLLTGPDRLAAAEFAYRRRPAAAPIGGFSAWLQDATCRTDEAMPVRLPDVAVTGPVGTALHDAARALTIANELIGDHLGDRVQPRTPEGLALAAGYQQADHLAATARIAAAAASLDVRLSLERWLRPTAAASAWTPLILVVNHDVQRSPGIDPKRTHYVHVVAAAGAAERGFARQLESVPLIDDPHLWARVASAQQAIAALDAARTWLHNYGHDLTAGQINASARAALGITAHLGEVLSRTGSGHHPVTDMCRTAARSWRNAMFAAAALRSNVAPGSSDVGVASTALTAVAGWLTGHVRFLPPARAGGRTASTRRDKASRSTAGRIAVRLADCAELLRDGVAEIRRRGNLSAAQDLLRPSGSLLHVPRWEPASAGHATYRQLINSLASASVRLLTLAEVTGERRVPGRREADQAEASMAIHTRSDHDRRSPPLRPVGHTSTQRAR